MFKKKLLSGLAIVTLLLPMMVQTIVSKTTFYAQNNAVYSVTQYLQEGSDKKGQTITIEGYITGSLKSQEVYGDVNTNIALGQSVSAMAQDTVAIQLPKGNVRQQYNIIDNPALKGKKVRITGISDQYFKRNGIKPLTTLEVIDNDSTVSDENTSNTATTESTHTTNLDTTAVTPINIVRQSAQQQSYTVAGKIISVVNGWGGQGFYIQDQSQQGLYVYSKNALGYHIGDIVQLTGTLNDYKGELQLSNITEHHVVTQGTIDTATSIVTLNELANDKQSTLIQISHVTVGEVTSDSYGTASFTITDSNGKSLPVRVDNRTGVNASQLLTKMDRGDVINITGILSTYNGKLQLKPFDLTHFEVVEKAKNDTTLTVLKVGDIQGESHMSPFNQRHVSVKNVIVTSVENDNRFYVQDIDTDNNEKTSDGISVSKANHTVAVGDILTISGVVNEYLGNGYKEKATTDLTITEIKATAIEKTGTGIVPAPLVLGVDKKIPTVTVDNDGMTSFDPYEDALDFWESLEGMIVAVDNAKILGPMHYKEVYVLPNNLTRTLNKVGGVSLGENENNVDRIPLLFKRGAFTVKSGDSFVGRLSGPVSYSYTNYKVVIDDTTTPTIIDGNVTPEKTTIQKDENKLTIASYNIENFSANKSETSDEKVDRIAKSVVSDLNTPDIITLIEVQDNNGKVNDGTTDATQSAKRLIDAIVVQGGVQYAYIDVAPENNQDGGAPGGNIRTGYLYNPQRVSLSSKPKGTTAQWENGELQYSVARIGDKDSLWQSVRKPLVAEFEFQGEKIVVIATHLNSKLGDNGLFGKVQPAIRHSESKRHQLAEHIRSFVNEGMQQNKEANIVVMGDFNDFEFTKTLQILESAGMTNVVKLHDVTDRFSYFYQGNNQTLDHLLISNNLLNRYTFDMVHVNSPFMVQHGRASDHDPIIVQLALKKENELSKEMERLEIGKPNKEQSETKTLTPHSENYYVQTQTSTNKEQNKVKKLQELPKTGTAYDVVVFGVLLLSVAMIGVVCVNKRNI